MTKLKLMPHNLEAERMVLGSILLDNSSLNKIMGEIDEKDFYTTNHQIIFRHLKSRISNGEAIDLTILGDALEKSKELSTVGGAHALMEICDTTPTATVIIHYAKIIKEKSNQRKLINFCQKAFDDWDNIDPDKLMGVFENLSTDINESKEGKEIFYAQDLKTEIEEIHKTGGLMSGVVTPWSNLTKLYKIRKGLFTVITGAPSSGKSNLLDNIIIHLAEREGWFSVIYSPENYPLGFHLSGLIEKYTGYPLSDPCREEIGVEGIKYAIDFLGSHLCFLKPRKSPTVENIFALTKFVMQKRAVDNLVIDPYNMLDNTRENKLSETEYIGIFLRKIREFSRKHNVHIFIVAHPRKLLKKKDDNFEVASAYDISASANWFNAADYILSVWRDMRTPENPVGVHVQKVRFKELGEPGCAKLRYCPDGRYEDYYDSSKDFESD